MECKRRGWPARTRRVGHTRLHRGGNASRWALSTSPWRLGLSTGPKASGCMSMRRSDVDNATPRVTRVEALSRVSPGFPPRAITYAGASTVVPLVHSPLVSPLSDSPCPVPAPGRVRVALGPVSACGGPLRGPAFSGPTCTTGAYRERAMESLIENTHMTTLPNLGHHSRFRVPRTLSSQTVCVTIELRHVRLLVMCGLLGTECQTRHWGVAGRVGCTGYALAGARRSIRVRCTGNVLPVPGAA